jgi:Fe-S-cluster containining protein
VSFGKPIVDLVQVRRLGEKKVDENLRFRIHLKTHDYVERRLKKIAQEIEEQIDCTQCAECCRVATTPVEDREIKSLAKQIGVSSETFIRDYTTVDEEGDRILRRTEQGCVFLEGNLCSIYEGRPATCRNYPHLVRGDGPISTRMWQMVDRATYCPIVYNSLEAFKVETRFRR